MIVGGTDPGLDGALCLISVDPEEGRADVISIISMPVLKLTKGKGTKREISVHALLEAIGREGNSLAERGLVVARMFIEQVSPRPGEGTVSAFKFGRGFGQVETAIIASGWPIEYVTPQKWKRALGFPAGAEKDESLNRASQAMPAYSHLWTPKRLVITQAQCYGRAESALIAYHGARTLTRRA